MTLPDFDAFGLLPPGCYNATLVEIESRFCWNTHRQTLWTGFNQFLEIEYYAAGFTFPLWIDGSFVRDKPMPSDIDVVMDLYDLPDELVAQALLLRFRHDQFKVHYKIDLWHRHPMIPHDLAAYFQYAGAKCAMEKQIDPKRPKGILKVQP